MAGKQKAQIPALNPDGDGVIFPGAGGRINSYTDKPSQVGANVGWAFAANTAIVEPTAAVELVLNRRNAQGEKEKVTSGDALEILELMDAPNFLHTGEQMRQLHFTYMNLVGESYILMRGLDGQPFVPSKGKLPAALEILPAHRVRFELGANYLESVVKVGEQSFPVASLIRDLNPDPSNPMSGRSIIAASAAAIGLDEQMKEWNQSVFANGARPSLVFKTAEPLDNESYERFRKQFIDTHTGVDNAGKPLLIEGGDVTPLMLTQRDLDFLESRKFSRDEILAMFKVSPGMLGSVENVNRANLEAGFYVNAVVNVLPRIRQFVRQINATLVKVYDPDLELDFVSPVPEDAAAKLAAVTAGVDKWWTKDEVRELFGAKPLPDHLGEQIIVAGVGNTLESVVDGTAVPAPQPATTPTKELPADGVKKKN